MTYGRLAPMLHERGLALHNLASLPHISVGGAIATGTHGSGDRLGNLATAVSAIDIVRSDGEIVASGTRRHRLRRRSRRAREHSASSSAFAWMSSRSTRSPSTCTKGLAWDELAARFDEITGAGYSVSLFTTWGSHVDQVWVKQRLPSEPIAHVRGRPTGHRRPPSDRRRVGRELHTTTGRAGAVVGPAATFQDGLHAEQRATSCSPSCSCPRGRRSTPSRSCAGSPTTWHRTYSSARSARSPPTRCG